MKVNNRRIVLAKRPNGLPSTENFRLETEVLPKIKQDELLLRAIYISLDPYIRGKLNDHKSYISSIAIDNVIECGTVCQVQDSKHPQFEKGEWVLAYTGWQDYAVSDGEGLVKLGKSAANPSYALGIMGMPGFTAYVGLLHIAQVQAGDTLVVAAAAGPVGGTVGQIAKLKGARVIGVAGGTEKCRYVEQQLGFDLCLDHYADDFAEQLADNCPSGIDIYYENVGGKVFDAVLPLLNVAARIPVCGLISQYNQTELPNGPDRLSMLMANILGKRLKIQGFIIFDHYQQYFEQFQIDMALWLKNGDIQYGEHIVQGLENTPEAFIGLFSGKNHGKLVMQINTAI